MAEELYILAANCPPGIQNFAFREASEGFMAFMKDTQTIQ